MPGLAATGTLAYNGYTFDGATRINVHTEFVLEDAGRSIKAHRHTITVHAVIANDGTSGDLDSDLLTIRRRLGEAGRSLRFVAKGFGNDLTIGGRKRDVISGPTPTELSWTPIGDDKAAEIVWKVVVTVPLCRGSQSYRGIMSINWGLSYALNRHGGTIRTLAGHIEIAASGGVSGVGRDTADRYRRAFAPSPIEGFTRQQQWDVSPDKRRCDFTIVDTELSSPNPYPGGTTAIDCKHRWSWNRSRAAQSTNTLSATIRMAPNISASRAWSIFLNIFINRAFRQVQPSNSLFLESVDIEEDFFNRPQTFRVTWRNMSSPFQILSNLKANAGLWQKLPNTWPNWHESLIKTTFDQRGHAQLHDEPRDDAIIDLCLTGSTTITPNNSKERPPEISSFTPLMSNSTPPAEQSFLEYNLFLKIHRKCPVSRQAVLQKPDQDTGGANFDNDGNPIPSQGPVFGNSEGAFIEDLIQQGGAYRYTATLTGHAKRAGHRIPRPILKKIGKRDAVEIEGEFMEKDPVDHLGVLVHEAAWRIHFAIGGAPDAVDAPKPRRPTTGIRTIIPGRPTNPGGSTNTFQTF